MVVPASVLDAFVGPRRSTCLFQQSCEKLWKFEVRTVALLSSSLLSHFPCISFQKTPSVGKIDP